MMKRMTLFLLALALPTPSAWAKDDALALPGLPREESFPPVAFPGTETRFVVVAKTQANTGFGDQRKDRFLAFTAFYPVAGEAARWERKFYGRDTHLPLPWREASLACAGLKESGAEWRLPTLKELRAVGSGASLPYNIYQDPVKSLAFLPEAFVDISRKGSQFHYFWSSQEDKGDPEALARATKFTLDGEVSVSHTKQKPLSYFCVTYVKRGEPLASSSQPAGHGVK